MYDDWEEDSAGWRRRPERDPLIYTLISILVRLALFAGVLGAIYFVGAAFYGALTDPRPAVVAPSPSPRATRTPPLPSPTLTVAITPSPSFSFSPTRLPTTFPTISPTSGAVGRQFRVANTGGAGVLLRTIPSRTDRPSVGLNEGALVTTIAPPFEAEGELWYQVRDLNGNTGFVPAEYLVPVR